MKTQTLPTDGSTSAAIPGHALDPEAPRAASDSSFVWSDDRLLGFKPIDDIHQEFYSTALGLITCSEASLASVLEAFHHHAVKHFGEEDEWMQSTGFPPRDCHMDEHAAVLDTVRELQGIVAAGRATPALIQDFGVHLFRWFPGHANHLDSALAAWMCKRALGGKPVVFKRRLG